MAAITAAMVKELRETSGAGMMECKKALTEADGNMEAAVEILRKSGAMKATKKASRIAAEGLCCVAKDNGGKTAAVVEVNSETDFVAKNEKFQSFVSRVAAQALASKASDMDSFMAEAWVDDASKTVKDVLNDMILTIGEKLDIRRFKKVESSDLVESYIHGGGRIAVIVEATGEDKEGVREAMKNIAMQVAAMNPRFTFRNEVDQAFIDHEKEVILAQIEADPKEAAKPDKVKEGMVQGRINKELKEFVLMDQVYVRAEDGKQTVAKYIEEVAKKEGTNFAVKSVVRFETGEGIAKKEENFAEEVAKQMNG